MKRATQESLLQAEKLLEAIRELGVVETKPGVFIYRGKALLHFHEKDGILFCDLKNIIWSRHPTGNEAADKDLLLAIKKVLTP